MSLYLEEEGAVQLPIDCLETARLVMEETLSYLGCPYEAEVDLLLTTDEKIREINQTQRGIDRPTDVLSFPMIDFGQVSSLQDLEGLEDCFHPETGELMLGDIVISKDRVIFQAREYAHSIKREFAFLIAHSMLHLFGYDHMEDQERTEMEAMQRRILERIHITRQPADPGC